MYWPAGNWIRIKIRIKIRIRIEIQCRFDADGGVVVLLRTITLDGSGTGGLRAIALAHFCISFRRQSSVTDDIMLTESSFKKLQEELDYLKKVKRSEIAEALRKARGFGDLSENFEYHAARRDQGILNGKIAELEKTLEIAKVVPDSAAGGDTVGLGSIVLVRDLDLDDEWEYSVVDPVQADPVNDKISIQSPVGQALLNKKVGDVVEVQIPAGAARYEILSLRH